MLELQGRVGSELSACATYIYIYIYASKTNKENLYDVEFNNVKTKIYGNIK